MFMICIGYYTSIIVFLFILQYHPFPTHTIKYNAVLMVRNEEETLFLQQGLFFIIMKGRTIKSI